MAKAYQRVVNGKVVEVNAYASESTTTTSAARRVRALPGRPRMAAQPGSYASGRDLPGQKARKRPQPPRPEQPNGVLDEGSPEEG